MDNHSPEPHDSEDDTLTPERLITQYATPNPILDAMLLPGLNSIAWSAFEHAHGEASDVPALLRAILSPIEHHRDFAFQLLFETVWHQGTVYSASAVTAPFLIGLLTNDATPDKASVLQLLAALAEGHSYLAVHERTPEEIADARVRLAMRGIDFDEELQQELGWVKASYNAVALGVPVFLQLLNQSDPTIYTGALYILSKLPTMGEAILPPVRQLFEMQTDRSLKAHTLRALEAVAPATSMDIAFFNRILQSEQDNVLRVMAAAAILKRQGTATPSTIIDLLIDVCSQFGTDDSHCYETWTVDARYYPHPWGDDKALVMAHAFAGLGLPDGAQALQTALARITNSEIAFVFVERLLDVVYGDKKGDAIKGYTWTKEGRERIEYWIRHPTTPQQQNLLNRYQRRALSCIADHASFWQIDTNLFEVYGLPSSRRTLREWATNS
ncbi:MAG: hypothetical protein M3R24_08950 [Chloroflexota bacterium]|nr:hypothetical protein [Chloroflexota bacterium]